MPDIFQKGSAGFKATIDLNKKLLYSISIWNMKGKTIKADGRKFLLDALNHIYAHQPKIVNIICSQS